MSLQTCFKLQNHAIQPPLQARRSTVRVIAHAESDQATSRRMMLGLSLAAPLLLSANPAQALGKDLKAAAAAAKARKEKLKEAAKKMKEGGKTTDAFADSNYSLPEESRTPNMRGMAGNMRDALDARD